MAQPRTGSTRPSLESLLRAMVKQQSVMMDILGIEEDDSEDEPKGEGVKDSEENGESLLRAMVKQQSVMMDILGIEEDDTEDEPKGDGVKDSEENGESLLRAMVKQQSVMLDILGIEEDDSDDEPKGDGVKDSEDFDEQNEMVDEEDFDEQNEMVDEEEDDSEDEPKGDGVKDSETAIKVEKKSVEVEESEKAEVEKKSVEAEESEKAQVAKDNAGLCDLDDATNTQAGEIDTDIENTEEISDYIIDVPTTQAGDIDNNTGNTEEISDCIIDVPNTEVEKKSVEVEESEKAEVEKKSVEAEESEKAQVDKRSVIETESADDTSKPADDNSKPSDDASKHSDEKSGTDEKEPTKESGTGKKEPKPGTGEEALRELPCYDTLLETLKKGIYSFQTSGEKINMKLGIGDFDKGNHARRRLLILKKLTRCQKVWIYAKEFSQMQESMLEEYDIDDLRNELAIYNSLRTLKNGQVNLCYPYSFMLVKYTEKTFRLLINVFEKGKPWPYYCEGERKNYFVFLMEYGEITLEMAIKSRLSYEDLLVLFRRICIVLAIGKEEIELLHDDLHINNVLVAETEEKLIKYEVASKKIKIPTLGYIAKVIDFGNARCIKDINYRQRMISKYGKRPCPVEYSGRSLFMLSELYFEMINMSLEIRAALPELPRVTTSLQLYEGFIQVLKDLAILEFHEPESVEQRGSPVDIYEEVVKANWTKKGLRDIAMIGGDVLSFTLEATRFYRYLQLLRTQKWYVKIGRPTRPKMELLVNCLEVYCIPPYDEPVLAYLKDVGKPAFIGHLCDMIPKWTNPMLFVGNEDEPSVFYQHVFKHDRSIMWCNQTREALKRLDLNEIHSHDINGVDLSNDAAKKDNCIPYTMEPLQRPDKVNHKMEMALKIVLYLLTMEILRYSQDEPSKWKFLISHQNSLYENCCRISLEDMEDNVQEIVEYDESKVEESKTLSKQSCTIHIIWNSRITITKWLEDNFIMDHQESHHRSDERPLYSICLHPNQVAVKLNEKLLTNIGIFKKSGKRKVVGRVGNPLDSRQS
ncbi:GSG2 [Cordylochernes scorpioides]|uniref:GSG2 n=1 Tax=Cordylochernes scorpioides TaxID=51811 RepID=A0ABY6KN67_9ARAC|nr:GSG2 [Cordylochernes scorpioides]